jgi:excinuclease ABC subunit A
MKKLISIEGASSNNLKKISCQIPWYSLCVITGLSGSGKSSLAIDTIHSESRRRYLESLSTYARQFLEKIEKPEVTTLKGLPPSICIESRNTVKNSRSTVGTLTEIYDYMRVIFSRIGSLYCPECLDLCSSLSTDGMYKNLLKNFKDKEILIGIDNNKNIDSKELRKIGIYEVVVSNQVQQIQDCELETREMAPLIDKIIVNKSNFSRIIESLEFCFSLSSKINIYDAKINLALSYKKELCCPSCLKEYKRPTPNHFSFNTPNGACSECKGFGNILRPDMNLIVEKDELTIEDGAISILERPSLSYEKKRFFKFCLENKISTSLSFSKLSKTNKNLIIWGDHSYKGIVGLFKRLERKAYKMHIRVLLSKYRSPTLCSKCDGSRINVLASQVQVEGYKINDLCNLSIDKLQTFFYDLEDKESKNNIIDEPLRQCGVRLKFLMEVGLEYLTLNRLGKTLSGGEIQRVNLSQQLGSELTDTLYVLDEPSIGLHPKDITNLLTTIINLRDLDNTIVLIEHDLEIISKADWIIELGPKSGQMGGEIIHCGDFKSLKRNKKSITAKYLNNELSIKKKSNKKISKGRIKVKKASKNNVENLDFEIPLGCITCVTGVSGSGKSTLIKDCFFGNASKEFGMAYEERGKVDSISGLSRINELVMINQDTVGTSGRSNPASYMKIYDDIRNLMSKAPESIKEGLKPGDFSFNTDGGRCADCKGEGKKNIEMQFLSDLEVICDSCNGKKFNENILGVKMRDKNINQILGLTIKEAIDFFDENRKIRRKLDILLSVGLGYLTLGQPTNTLSGGESQRIKIAKSLLAKNSHNVLYILDEPSIGLHVDDLKNLVKTFEFLVENNNTLVIIEHNLEIIKIADYIIDMGPGGGSKGGKILAAGTPTQVKKNNDSIIRQYL